MIWKIPEMIAVLSQYFELAAADVVMTGTPSGVGPFAARRLSHGHVAGVWATLHLRGGLIRAPARPPSACRLHRFRAQAAAACTIPSRAPR